MTVTGCRKPGVRLIVDHDIVIFPENLQKLNSSLSTIRFLEFSFRLISAAELSNPTVDAVIGQCWPYSSEPLRKGSRSQVSKEIWPWKYPGYCTGTGYILTPGIMALLANLKWPLARLAAFMNDDVLISGQAAKEYGWKQMSEEHP